MPAFEAWAQMPNAFGEAVPIVNVAYGQADAEWARRYRVGEHLVVDRTGRRS
jgi:hypothetical protein